MDKGIRSSPATEDLSLATTMEKKIKALDSDLIVNEVFITNPASSSEFILGPCFRDRVPSELVPFYPLEKGEKLLLHSLEPGWNEGRTWKSWSYPSKMWINWVDRLEKEKGEKWRNAGIYDAIQLSKIDIPFDKNLLYAALCFWSISSNSFHFNFGMMGPTVLDIVALTGLRPHGEDISAILCSPKSTFTLPRGENGKRLSYGKFLELSMKKGDVTENEHISFLIMWLCKYVFCNGSGRVTKECSELAIALAEGRKLALAPFVLSHLYRGCRDLVLRRFGCAGGPFWILQLWLQSYFPEYGPLTYEPKNCLTYGVSLAQGKLKHKSFQECFKFFYSCSSRSPSQFTPFFFRTLGPEWQRLSLHHHCITSSKQDLSDIWSSYLIARDLHYGLVLGNSIFCKAGVEYYSPNQFARQFGMTQAVPLPPYQSANTSSLGRIVFHSVNCIQEVDSKFVQLKKKFSAVHFDANPKCTPSFESWWSNYIGKTRIESAEEILGRICSDFQLTPSTMQEKRNFQPDNSECHAQIAGEQETRKRRNEEYISQQNKLERQEKDETPSRKAKRQLFLADFPKFFAHNTPEPAINITKHSPAVHGSNHLAESVNSQKSVTDVVVLDNASSSTSPLSSDEKSRSKDSVRRDLIGDHSKISDAEDFFARVATQLQDAKSPGIDVKSPALRMSRYSAQVLNKTKAEVQKLLMMPLHDIVLPENSSVLVAALPIYAASPNLSVEKVRALKELEKNLPSLFSDFHQAKRQQKEYTSKVAKKVILIDELTKEQDLYNDLKHHRSRIDTSISSIRTQISELKTKIKEEKMKRRAIQEQELNLKNKNSPKLAALEKLGAEFLDSEKQLADSLASKAEISWADYQQKIIGLGM